MDLYASWSLSRYAWPSMRSVCHLCLFLVTLSVRVLFGVCVESYRVLELLDVAENALGSSRARWFALRWCPLRLSGEFAL